MSEYRTRTGEGSRGRVVRKVRETLLASVRSLRMKIKIKN
jgi:hypothetical protein